MAILSDSDLQYFSDITNGENSAMYVGESIKLLNKRMNIHRKGKSRFEISINHYKNVCKKIFFTIQIIKKLPGNGNKNGSRISSAAWRLLGENIKFYLCTCSKWETLIH